MKQLAEENRSEIQMVAKPIESPVLSSVEDQILEAVESAPTASILLAWSGLESVISSTVARLSISPDPPSYRSPKHNIYMLAKYAGLNPSQEILIDELRMIRNKVAHDGEAAWSISQEDALSYATTAIDLIGFFETFEGNCE